MIVSFMSFQITPATSYAGTTAEIIHLNPQVAAESGENPDLLSQLRPLDDEIRLALLNKASGHSTIRTKVDEDTPPQIPRRSTSYDIFSKPAMPKLSPPTPFADDSEDSFPHIIPTKKVRKTLNNVSKCSTNNYFSFIGFRKQNVASEVKTHVRSLATSTPIQGRPFRSPIRRQRHLAAKKQRRNSL